MGYFPNGTEAEMYQAKYCENCHNFRGGACPVLALHFIYNYDECNKKDSFLEHLIPRTPDRLHNGECAMFLPKHEVPWESGSELKI